jgi:purine-binding chemotaxis protein CheW
MNAIAPIVTVTQHLTFFVGDEEYAVPVLAVREVAPARAITRVPRMPPAVRGVMNLRGNVVPIIDLGVRLGLTERPITKWTCIVVVMADTEDEPSVMGLLVDAVHQVIDLEPSAIEPAPHFGARVPTDLLKGIGVVGAKFVLLLDERGVLSVPDLLAASAPPELAPS